MAKDDKNKNKHYFMPGEFIVMVGHDASTAPSDAITLFLQNLDILACKHNKLLAEENKQQIDYPLLSEIKSGYEPRSFSRPASDNKRVSITKLRIESDDEEEQIKNVVDWMNLFADHYYNDATTNVITPNWFSIPAPLPSSDGGPGSKPEPELSPIWKPLEGAITKKIGTPDEPCPVDVFVLDSIPDAERLEWAASHLGSHEIWQRVQAQSLSKRAPYASKELVPWLDDLTGPKHDYEMPDHGLFIAGTIAMLAPNADIHLVQVLNKYGVGTLESVLEGLEYVMQNRNADRKTVVNCSFMFSIPLTNPQLHEPVRADVREFLTKHTVHGDEYVLDDTEYIRCESKSKGKYKRLDPKPELERWLVRPLIEVLNVLYNQIALVEVEENILDLTQASGVMIFAAAGNDGNDDNPDKKPKHPPASYPAAYRPVHGVGALDKSKPNQMAKYSNIADTPVSDGFLTFGGFPSDMGVGMLGLYIHPTFPDIAAPDDQNTNGWARWSGTSFATGVMSGLAAALLCHRSPREVLELFYGLPDTGFGEPHEVDVEQS
jgi:subtilisin family serine protease